MSMSVEWRVLVALLKMLDEMNVDGMGLWLDQSLERRKNL